MKKQQTPAERSYRAWGRLRRVMSKRVRSARHECIYQLTLAGVPINGRVLELALAYGPQVIIDLWRAAQRPSGPHTRDLRIDGDPEAERPQGVVIAHKGR